MKIAVLGAPGAGKTEFAGRLAAELQSPEDKTMTFLTLDDVVEVLRTKTGQEYGMLSNHIDDLTIVFKRLEWETHWSRLGRNTITVGTVLDSAAHNFARAEVVKDEEAPLTQIKLQAIAATFGMLYTDTWDYDYAFLLEDLSDPYGEPLRYHRTIQYTLGALIGSYRAPVFTFDNPKASNDEKANLAAEAIRALEEGPVAPTPERGVRRGGEVGEVDGDSSKSVPDVPEQGREGDDS